MFIEDFNRSIDNCSIILDINEIKIKYKIIYKRFIYICVYMYLNIYIHIEFSIGYFVNQIIRIWRRRNENYFLLYLICFSFSFLTHPMAQFNIIVFDPIVLTE